VPLTFRTWQTYCAFEYFLVSLKDGRVLWAATCEGVAYNQMDNYLKSLSAGRYGNLKWIDEMVQTFPKEIFKKTDEMQRINKIFSID
jgi:hypothetical protein